MHGHEIKADRPDRVSEPVPQRFSTQYHESIRIPWADQYESEEMTSPRSFEPRDQMIGQAVLDLMNRPSRQQRRRWLLRDGNC